MERLDSSRKWYVAYTLPKSEKKVAREIEDYGFESFLPLQKVIRQWSDRKKVLHVPLIPSYVFFCSNNSSFHRLLDIEGLVKFVSFEGIPATIPDREIQYLRKLNLKDFKLEVVDYQIKSDGRIKVTYGPLKGIEGFFALRNGKKWITINIDALQRAVSIEIPEGAQAK